MKKSFRTVYHDAPPFPGSFCLHVMGYHFKRAHMVDSPAGISDWFINLFHNPVKVLCCSKIIEVPSATIIINAPGEPIHHGTSGEWRHSWLRIGGNSIGRMIKASGLHPSKPYPLNDDTECLLWLESIDLLMRHSHGEDTAGVKKLVELWLHRIDFMRHKHKSHVTPEAVRRIMRYIEENFTRAIDLATLSDIAYLSRSQMCRLFRKHTGTSPINYMMQCRIEYAKELLQTSDLSIGEISLCCGFSDISYFSRTFKQRTGITPIKVRK